MPPSHFHKFAAEALGQLAGHREQQGLLQLPDGRLPRPFAVSFSVVLYTGCNDGFQPLLPDGGQFQFRMREVHPALEGTGLAEEDVLLTRLQRSLQPADALEPHQIDTASGIGEGRGEPAALLLAGRAQGTKPAPQLYLRHVLVHLRNAVEAAAVHIAEGKW
jgi:hypothetical protein